MWKVDSNNKITLTRGDTPSFKLNLYTTDESGNKTPYVPTTGDDIIFAIKKTAYSDTTYSIIHIPTDTLMLTFSQNDTRNLTFGDYVYEISLNNAAAGYHDTFIANTPITISEELYNG